MADGDRLLDAIGVLLVVGVIAAAGVVVLAATSLGPSSELAEPNVEWTIERVDDSTVRITHAGGEPVPASELVVTVDGYERHVSWSGRIAEGDSGLVRASRGQVVRLYWTRGGGARELLDRWRV